MSIYVLHLPNGHIVSATPDSRQGWIEYSEADYNAWKTGQPAPLVEAVTPWQMLCALNQLGLREAVEAAVAAGDQNTKDAWNRATKFPRNSPLLAGVATSAGIYKVTIGG